jgi:hypothetical protein
MGQFCSIICGAKEEPRRATAFADASSSSSDIPDFHYSQPSPSLLHGQQQRQLAATASSGASTPNAPGNNNNNTTPLLDPGSNKGIEENEDTERQLAQYRLEQAELARREAIVTAASQSMVPVGNNNFGSSSGHSNSMTMMGMHNHHHRMMGYQQHNHNIGGIMNSYYDPAYAAEAAQSILRGAAHTGGLVFSNDMATHAAMNVSIVGTLPKPSISISSSSLATTRTTNSKDVIDMLGKGIWDGVRLGSRGRLAGCGGEDPEYYLDDLAEAILETMVPTKTSLFGGCPPIVENLP